MSDSARKIEGILLIDKPSGMTSARAVDRVKRLLPRGIKVGHAGTLDPFATGLLVLLVGRATRQCEVIMGQPKTYDATVKLGATTETDDPESEERCTGVAAVQIEQVRAALPAFIGEIAQVPPAYSALKIGGRRAADRVRAGQTVCMQPRTVRVYAIDLVDYAWPLLRLQIDCGRGTYVRAIARDLGAALGAGGYLTQLRRTRIGPYDVGNAVNLSDPPDADRLLATLLPVDPTGV